MATKNEQHWDDYEKYEKLKMSLLKNIYLSQRVTQTFIIELWAKAYGKTYKEGFNRYNELYHHVKGQWEDYLFAEYGTINLKDIFPEEPPQTEE